MAVDNDMSDEDVECGCSSTMGVRAEISRLASKKTPTLKVQVIEKIKAPQGR